jgi:hypothetical protein
MLRFSAVVARSDALKDRNSISTADVTQGKNMVKHRKRDGIISELNLQWGPWVWIAQSV